MNLGANFGHHGYDSGTISTSRHLGYLEYLAAASNSENITAIFALGHLYAGGVVITPCKTSQ